MLDRLQRASESAADMLWEWEPQTGRLWCSEKLRLLLMQKPPSEWIAQAEDAEGLVQAISKCQELGSPLDHQFSVVHQGVRRWYRARGRVVCDPSTQSTLLSGGLTEITEHREAAERTREVERRLVQVQRLGAVQGLAMGVAHEFNNLLQALSGYLSLCVDEAVPGSTQQEDLRSAIGFASRGANLSRQLLTFVRQDSCQDASCSLGEAICEVQEFCGNLYGREVPFRTELPEEPLLLATPGIGLRQALLNLSVNAIEAVLNQKNSVGSVTIRLEEFHAVNAHRSLMPQIPAGRCGRISVIDRGVGMEPEVLRRAGEPFFTTKPPGEGPGLGLAAVFGIVRGMGGCLGIESVKGVGTAASIYLPLEEPENKSLEQPSTGLLNLPTARRTLVSAHPDQRVAELAERLAGILGVNFRRICFQGAGPITGLTNCDWLLVARENCEAISARIPPQTRESVSVILVTSVALGETAAYASLGIDGELPFPFDILGLQRVLLGLNPQDQQPQEQYAHAVVDKN